MASSKDSPAHATGPALTLPVTESDHHLNPISAQYTLVEYGDFECPDCAEGYHVVRELLRDLGEDLCYVFRNFPKTAIHPNAQLAAEAAEAADMQAKFWLMHDRLFEHQPELSRPRIHQLAREISLDMHRFDQDLDSGEPKRHVEMDRAEGTRAGVQATPTFFVNGRIQIGAYEYNPLFDALTSQKRTRS